VCIISRHKLCVLGPRTNRARKDEGPASRFVLFVVKCSLIQADERQHDSTSSLRTRVCLCVARVRSSFPREPSRGCVARVRSSFPREPSRGCDNSVDATRPGLLVLERFLGSLVKEDTLLQDGSGYRLKP
jgi:hypothetical protein